MTKIYVDTSQIKDIILSSRLEYTLDFIQNHPCAPDVKLSIDETVDAYMVISYSDQFGPKQIIPQLFFFNAAHKQVSDCADQKFAYNNMSLKGFCQRGFTEFMPCDIFETIFFHISRYEEWYSVDNQLDQHGSMASKEQYLVKNHLHSIPIVDLLVKFFFEKLGLIPKEVETSFTMTHDIDVLQKYPSLYKFMRGYGNIIRYHKNKVDLLLRHTRYYIDYVRGKNPDPYNSFGWLLIKPHPKITRKIIYWLVGGATQYEGFFDINDSLVSKVMTDAKNLDYSIGLHPSYNTNTDEEMMKEEWVCLNHVSKIVIEDSRQHFLRFDVKKTSKILDNLDIKTDSSIGYRDTIGFRCGTGFSYHLYDFDKECAYRFKEIPLVVMDMAAMHHSAWDSHQWMRLISQFIENNRQNTHITFNFHNSFFDPVLTDAEELKQWYIRTFSDLA